MPDASPPRRSLVIVGGPYKSGTSRLCEAVEAGGYRNPAAVSGNAERGHGIAMPIYLTRECERARALNRRLVKACAHEAAHMHRLCAHYLEEMFRELGPRIVIKDPYHKLMGVHWVRAAQLVGAPDVTVLLTTRPQAHIIQSWRNSRFLTRQLARAPAEFEALLRAQSSSQLDELRSLGADLAEVSFAEVPDRALTRLGILSAVARDT